MNDITFLSDEIIYKQQDFPTYYPILYDDKEQSCKIIKKRLCKKSVKIQHRISILNPDETVAYQIPEKDVVLDSISYSENFQSGQRKTLSFSLINTSGKYTPVENSQKEYYTNFYTIDRNAVQKSLIKNTKYNKHPIWGLTKVLYEIGVFVDEDNIVWFPKGVFVIESAEVEQNQGDKQVKITLNDKFSLLDGNTGKFLMTMEIPAGTPFIQLVKDLLNSSFGNGYSYDIKAPRFSHYFVGEKTSVSIKKEAGDTISSIIEELATQMSAIYYYNNEGYLTFEKIDEIMRDELKAISWIYENKNEDLLNLSLNYNFKDAVNIIKVVGNGIDEKVHYGLAVNNDARSPLNVRKIGNRIGDVITDANVWSDQMALELAQYHLRKNVLNCLSSSMTVKLNPLIELNKIVIINHSFFNIINKKYIVNSISWNSNKYDMSVGVTDISTLDFLNAKDEGYQYGK